MRKLHLPPPSHPLIALVDYNDVPVDKISKGEKVFLEFYKVSFKPDFKGQTKYGQGYYDFEEGGLAFLRPGQVVFTPEDEENYVGYALFFHADFINHYPLGNNINQFGFFSYDVSEALFLSGTEREILVNIFKAITTELQGNVDKFSQEILIAHIELLLKYSMRFYNRQFITRGTVNNRIIASLDTLLQGYLDSEHREGGLPSVREISNQLNLSPRYLSDMLRSATGFNTQQYLQNAVIEKAKEKLSTTYLSVSEIAYALGFEHPQSFSKFFKAKTSFSPLAFRRSFN